MLLDPFVSNAKRAGIPPAEVDALLNNAAAHCPGASVYLFRMMPCHPIAFMLSISDKWEVPYAKTVLSLSDTVRKSFRDWFYGSEEGTLIFEAYFSYRDEILSSLTLFAHDRKDPDIVEIAAASDAISHAINARETARLFLDEIEANRYSD